MARKIEVELVGNERNLVGAFNRTQSASSRLERNLSRLGHMTKVAIGVGVGAGLVGLAFAAHGVNKEFAITEKATAQTNAVIKSTGDVSNVSRKHVEGLAKSLMNKSGVDDQVIQSGENLLLTFTHVRNEVGKGRKTFDETTKVALDMSVALGRDLPATMRILGKALNDPIKNLGALGRVGITFNKAQTATIRKLFETGHAAQAQGIILGELEKRFRGSAAAAGKTLGGQIDILKQRLLNAGVYVESHFIPVFMRGIGVLGDFFGFLGKIAHAKNIAVGLQVSATGIKNFAGTIKDALARAVFGFTDDVTAGGAVVDKGLEGFAGRFHDGLVQKLMKQDWKTIGSEIATGISASLTFSSDSLNSLLNGMLSWVSSHTNQIATVGIEIAAALFMKLTDPSFWVHHVSLLLGVLLVAFGGSIGRGAGRFGEIILARLGPVFERAFGEVALLAMRGIARLPGFVGDAIAAAGTVANRGIRLIWREIVGQTRRGVGAAGEEASRLAVFMGRALRLGAVVAAFRAGMSAMIGLARSGGHAIASGISSALTAAGRAAHAFASAVTSAMHTVLAPIHAVVNAIQTLIGWLGRIPHDISIHIHVPGSGIVGKVRGLGGILPATGGVVPMLPGAMRGRDSVPALLTPGEMVLTSRHQEMLGGQGHLARLFGFGAPLQRFARGGIAKKKRHHSPHLPDSIRLAEARAAGTPGLGDDIAAVGRELAWINSELGGHDLTGSERANLQTRRVRVENRLRSLRGRQRRQREHASTDITIPARIRLAEANARLTGPGSPQGGRSGLDDDIRAKQLEVAWLAAELRKHPGTERRIALENMYADATDELQQLAADARDSGGAGGAGDSGDLQAQLDQARAQAAAAQEAARLANAFVATGVFGGGFGGGGGVGGGAAGSFAGGGGQQIVIQSLFPPPLDWLRQAAAHVAQGASMQPYRSTSVVPSGY